MQIQSYNFSNSFKSISTSKSEAQLPQISNQQPVAESKVTRQGAYFTYTTYLKNGMVSKVEPTGTVKSMQL